MSIVFLFLLKFVCREVDYGSLKICFFDQLQRPCSILGIDLYVIRLKIVLAWSICSQWSATNGPRKVHLRAEYFSRLNTLKFVALHATDHGPNLHSEVNLREILGVWQRSLCMLYRS